MTDSPRTQPHDLDAERAVLGSMMLSPTAVDGCEHLLRAADFYDARHGMIFAAIKDLRRRGSPVDAIQVKAAMQANGQLSKLGSPAFLINLIETTPAPASAAYYGQIVRDRAILREIITAAERMTQMAYQPGVDSADTLAEQVHEMTGRIRDHGLVDDLASALTLDEYLDRERPPSDWVIPNLLHRGDRVLFTGSEGLGKSTLLRQLAVCTAAGLSPFSHQPIQPKTVLAVDCENPDEIMYDSFRALRAAAKQAGHPVDRRLIVERRPEGLDLNRPEDVRWLMRRVEMFAPDLLTIGPIYKLHVGNPNDEEVARGVAVVLDRARLSGHGCALAAEAHSRKGDDNGKKRPLDPYGSSLWLRWPEFGYGLRRFGEQEDENGRPVEAEVIPWRGPRDPSRHWPRRLRMGGSWPWTLPLQDLHRQAALSPQDRASGEREDDPWANQGRLG